MSEITKRLVSTRTAVQSAQDLAFESATEYLTNGDREKHAKIEAIRAELNEANKKLLELLQDD